MRATFACLAFAAAMALAPSLSPASYKVCIDPGHGGSDSGAVGCGLEEAAVNLQVGLILRDILQADPDLTPIMTRDSDSYVSLQGRCDYANDSGADRFASVHCNAASVTASGIETYCYYNGSANSFDQRDRVQQAMTEAWPALPDRGGKTAGFYVIKHTSMPATLSELAFITNCQSDATYLASQSHLQEAATAHHDAIRKSLGLPGTVGPPPVGTGVLRGVVFEEQGVGTGDMSIRLPGALVEAEGDADSVSTIAGSPTGDWKIGVKAGNYVVTASLDGYFPASRECAVVVGQETWCSLGLEKKPDVPPPPETGTLKGVVYEEQGGGDMSVRLTGAFVAATGSDGKLHLAKAQGADASWQFDMVPGNVLVVAAMAGHWTTTRTCTVEVGQETWCSVGLAPKPVVEPPPVFGTIQGVIYEDKGGVDMSLRLPGSIVAAAGPDGELHMTQAQDPDAFWTFDIEPGVVVITASMTGYWTNSRACSVNEGGDTWCSLGLLPMDTEPTPITTPDDEGPTVSDGPVPPLDMGGTQAEQAQDASGANDTGGHEPESQGYLVSDAVLPNAATSSGGCAAGGGSPKTGAAWLLVGLICMLGLARRRATRSFAGPLMVAAIMLASPSASGRDNAGIRMIDAGHLTASGDYEQPVWSPDGRTIAFAGKRFSRLYAVPASGGEPALVAKGRSAGYEPVWFDDSRAIGYRRPGQRLSEVPALSVRIDGKTARRAPANPTPGTWARVVDDAVYLRTGRTQRLVSPAGDRYFAARLSADGGKLVFHGLSTGIWVHDVGSGRLINLGEGNHARFSHDGRRLVFDRCTDDGARLLACEIVIADLDGQEPILHAVEGAPRLARQPCLSPDGMSITFESGGAIWTARLSGMPR